MVLLKMYRQLISYCAILYLFLIVQCCRSAFILPALSTIEQEEPTSASEPFGHSLKDYISEILGQTTNPVPVATTHLYAGQHGSEQIVPPPPGTYTHTLRHPRPSDSVCTQNCGLACSNFPSLRKFEVKYMIFS